MVKACERSARKNHRRRLKVLDAGETPGAGFLALAPTDDYHLRRAAATVEKSAVAQSRGEISNGTIRQLTLDDARDHTASVRQRFTTADAMRSQYTAVGRGGPDSM